MKFNAAVAACVLASSVCWGTPSSAQVRAPLDDRPAATSEALRTAVDAAWKRALGSHETQAAVRRAQAERLAADRLWATPPALEIQHRNDRLQSDAGKRETEVGLAWPLWLPGQRASHQAQAQADIDRASAAERAARWQVAGMVREAAWRLITERIEREELVQEVDVLRRLHGDVERRVQAGDLARADALAARAEWLAAQSRLGELEQRQEEARIRWQELTGSDDVPPTDRIRERERISADRTHPELDAAERAVELARRRLELVRLSTREAPELKVGMRQDVSGGVEGTHNSLQIGIRVPFGTNDRNLPLEAAAASELDVAAASERRLRARIDADVASARAALESARRQAEAQAERARLLRERADLIDRSFRAGEGALPDLLRALGAAAQAHAAAARQAAAVDQTRARLNQALGVLP